MNDTPEFAVPVPVRCFHEKLIAGHLVICGLEARWQRNCLGSAIGFFCDAHRMDGDTSIVDGVLIRRVSLIAEVVFSGTSLKDTCARVEALNRLQEAVTAAGGTLNIHQATSTLGRYRLPAPEPVRNASRARGR